MKLIVNADDFGLSEAVNYGIIKAYTDGVVRSTTLMVNMGAVPHALELHRRHTGLGLGIHLVLTAGRPFCGPRIYGTANYNTKPKTVASMRARA